MSETLYTVHTRTCTYMLDEDGICRWVRSPSNAPADVSCIGAQFVACLDLRVNGGLVGELLVGAFALFVRNENGRAVLLRTTPIEQVEFRRPADVVDPPTVTLPGSLSSPEDQEVDIEDLATYSSEVTRTMPLYRPETQGPSAPPRPAWGSGWPGGYDGNNG
ncbi:MAG TPA: hypothetical protein VK459_14380 [Polyangiaceae bacterium]|nr:hypothetical protein [Polyangiaceae bacterium]